MNPWTESDSSSESELDPHARTNILPRSPIRTSVRCPNHYVDYDCDKLCLNSPSDSIGHCKYALAEYNKKWCANYRFVGLLGAHHNTYGPCATHDLTFTASFTDSDSHVHKFRARVVYGSQINNVEEVTLVHNTLYRYVGYCPRTCVYDSDIETASAGYFSIDVFGDELARMSNLAIQAYDNNVVGMSNLASQPSSSNERTKYVYQAPLKAYYWKNGDSRYIHIRFKASLPRHNVGHDDVETIEAQICFEDQPFYGPWSKSGGIVESVSQGHGSIFTD